MKGVFLLLILISSNICFSFKTQKVQVDQGVVQGSLIPPHPTPPHRKLYVQEQASEDLLALLDQVL